MLAVMHDADAGNDSWCLDHGASYNGDIMMIIYIGHTSESGKCLSIDTPVQFQLMLEITL